MSTTTTNLKLVKPAVTDNVSIADINGNMDIVDEHIGTLSNKINGISDYIVESGVSGGWYYEKIESGICKLYATIGSINAAKDDNQAVSPYNNIVLPFELKSCHSCNVSQTNNSWKIGRAYGSLACPTSAVAVTCYIDSGVWNSGVLTATDQFVSINICGRWK